MFPLFLDYFLGNAAMRGQHVGNNCTPASLPIVPRCSLGIISRSLFVKGSLHEKKRDPSRTKILDFNFRSEC